MQRRGGQGPRRERDVYLRKKVLASVAEAHKTAGEKDDTDTVAREWRQPGAYLILFK